MRVSSSQFSNNLILQVNQLQAQQTRLQTQATTGLKVSLPEDNPEVIGQVLNLQTQASANTQFQSNVAALQASANLSAGAMNTLQTLTEKASEIAISANGVNSPEQLAAYATQVDGLLQQAIQAANAKDSQGNYLFGGVAAQQPPFSTTTDAQGNITAVTYQGSNAVLHSQIASNLTVSVQTPGANPTGVGPPGLLGDSRTGADLFSHLISLKQNLQAGNTAAIASTDTPNLAKDEDGIVSAIAGNGVVQTTLQSTSSTETQLGTNLLTQTSDLTSADLATTITQLDQAQTAYQAAMQSGVMIMKLSILNYL